MVTVRGKGRKASQYGFPLRGKDEAKYRRYVIPL